MGNFITRSCYDQSNPNSLQVTIDGLVKENEELKKKIESLEEVNSDKNLEIDNNNLDIIEDQLKILISEEIDKIMETENINSELISDYVERKIYDNVFIIAKNILKETLKKTKITILNQDITFNIQPSK